MRSFNCTFHQLVFGWSIKRSGMKRGGHVARIQCTQRFGGGEPKEVTPHGRPRRRCAKNINMHLKQDRRTWIRLNWLKPGTRSELLWRRKRKTLWYRNMEEMSCPVGELNSFDPLIYEYSACGWPPTIGCLNKHQVTQICKQRKTGMVKIMSGTNRNFRAAGVTLARFTVRIHVQASRPQLVRHIPPFNSVTCLHATHIAHKRQMT